MEAEMRQALTYKEILPARIPELDGLRGLAIVLVVYTHYFKESINYEQSNAIIKFFISLLSLSWTGVDLFFVLSGFLIGGILIDNRNAVNYFKVFYLRRIFRIFPLYYFVLITFCGLVFLRLKGLIDLPGWLTVFEFKSWWYFVFLQNFAMVKYNSFGSPMLSVTWSLAVEEQFYLTFPFVIWFLSRKNFVKISLCIIATSFIVKVALIYFINEYAVVFMAPARADAFLLGALAAVAMRSSKLSSFINEKRPQFSISILIFTTFIFIYSYLSNTVTAVKYSMLVGFTLIAIFYTSILILAVTSKPGEAIGRIFRNRILRELGTIAYGVYLLHMPVIHFFDWWLGIEDKITFGAIWMIRSGLSLIFTLIIAKLSWHYLEKPLIKYSHRFQYEKDQPIAET